MIRLCISSSQVRLVFPFPFTLWFIASRPWQVPLLSLSASLRSIVSYMDSKYDNCYEIPSSFREVVVTSYPRVGCDCVDGVRTHCVFLEWDQLHLCGGPIDARGHPQQTPLPRMEEPDQHAIHLVKRSIHRGPLPSRSLIAGNCIGFFVTFVKLQGKFESHFHKLG